MADSESGYNVGQGRPPLHTRFQKEQSGNPGGRSTKSLPALLADASKGGMLDGVASRRLLNPPRRRGDPDPARRRPVIRTPSVERETLVNSWYPFSFVAGLVPAIHGFCLRRSYVPGWVYIMTTGPMALCTSA